VLEGKENGFSIERTTADGVVIYEAVTQVPLALIVDSITKLRGTGVNIRIVVIAVHTGMQAGRGLRRSVPIPIPVLAKGLLISAAFAASV